MSSLETTGRWVLHGGLIMLTKDHLYLEREPNDTQSNHFEKVARQSACPDGAPMMCLCSTRY